MPKFNNSATRNTLGDISVLYVAVMARAVRHEGVDGKDLFSQFKLSDQRLASPDARISIPRFMRLGQAAITLTGNSALGLTMGQLTRPVDAGLAGLAAQSAPTTAKALATLINYSLLTSRNSRGHPSLDVGARRVDFYSIRPYNIFNYFVVDSVLAAWTQFLRDITGRFPVLSRVTLEYPSQGLDDQFEEWFGCPVSFNRKSNSLYVAEDVLNVSPLQAQPAMHRQLEESCAIALHRIQSGWQIQDRVRETLAPLLEGGAPPLEQVASELGTAPWTLQRQLAREQTGYRQLIDETRRGLAFDYIRDTRLALAEVAYLLGFSNPAAFHKAYKRWFSLSPGEHRKALDASNNGTS
ncbi:AraC family transcriptional regulator [Marinobacter caseinilyticus]|uniref:AraC family transcriptional regulator n=1 Tax=Marinobacter caseinilyticus TaxID=2692195 RepID=UPI00140DF523|nr:AraC family transcriptional regulator [Marinobacter caseinilyticus]